LLAIAVVVLGFQASASAQPRRVTASQARAFKLVVTDAKRRVDRLISIGRQGHGGRGMNEEDEPALERLTMASGSLASASNHVDEMLRYSDPASLDPAKATLHFALACTDSAIALSRVSRARLAAVQPPVETLGAFAPEFDPIVTELHELRGAPVNCPNN
jgi:hypothetical protein